MNQKMIKKLEETITADYRNTTGIVIQKDGRKLYENYFNGFTAEGAVHVFSVTKSIISTLIGIAIDKGHISGVDAKVVDFFPDYQVPADEQYMQKVTIRHLLTMTAPFKYQNELFEEFFSSPNWVNASLDLLGGREPAGEFNYSPIIAAHILGGLLTRATGRTVVDYASEHLFTPLGIGISDNIELPDRETHMAFYAGRTPHSRGWVVDPQGINTTSWGLVLTADDMAKIGQLYLNGGKWANQQLISPEWIQTSTTGHVPLGQMAYGYLWWVIDEDQKIYAALGDGGNVIYVNGSENLVVAIASLFDPADRKDPVEFIMRFIEPMFMNNQE